MAEYWAKLSTGNLSEHFKNIGMIDTVSNIGDTFYAQGDDIDFKEFFSINLVKVANCIVYKSTLKECNLQNYGHRTGFSNHIIFEECQIVNLKITDLTLSTISFIKCVVDNIEIRDCREIDVLNIDKSTSVNKIFIGDNLIYNLHITEVKSINNITIKEGQIHNILIRDSLLGIFTCEDNRNLSDLSLSGCNFDRITFHNTHFEQQLSILDCKKGHLEFNLCEFKCKNVIVERNSVELLFYKVRSYVKTIFRFSENQESKVYFERCYFQEEVLFQGQMAQKEKNLLISDTVFKDLVLFDDDNAKCLEIKETLFQKGLLLPIPKFVKIHEIHSSVWCMLKNQAISRNDNIIALKYRKNELNSYLKELSYRNKQIQEKIVLTFNWISNNHGIDWIRGVVFTTLSWILFYSIFVMSKDGFNGFTNGKSVFLLTNAEFWSNAIDYLWIPQGLKDLSEGLKTNNVWWINITMGLSFILGKVFIAYGVFQTISAFRRHGKI
jgi:uncharacterized membrane protein YecN with MAPEG domain/uncharacterized protein YjbI with pentapeptide repeats